MSCGLILREGDAGDVTPLMGVMDRAFDPVFGEAWNRAQCLGILSLPDVWLTLAEDADGATIGFALSRLLIDDAELLLLAVAPDARGRGVGAALIERTAMIAATRGAGRLLLEMRDGNPAGVLYGRTGFGEIGRRRAYYKGAGGATFDAVTLARSVG